MAKPRIVKTRGYSSFTGTVEDAYAIVVGKDGKRWAPKGAQPGSYATFETRAKAEKFIAEGGLIEVSIVTMAEAERACGWVDGEGFSEDNIARFAEWAGKEGVFVYSRPREDFFPEMGIREAQRAGLAKIVMEDLS